MEKLYLSILHRKRELLEAIYSKLDEYSIKGELLPESENKALKELIRTNKRDESVLTPKEIEFNQRQEAYKFILFSEFPTLSVIEIQVCVYLLDGLSNKEIGNLMAKSDKSIERYLTDIRKKLGINIREHGDVRKFLRSFVAKILKEKINITMSDD